ncbi:hypothetical protein [Labedaea rhizosphaerae]|uniref:Uncharacterized protein n=1 Tax=Labedaea rhizosphaerae TaxID=598644 RepID=A0A4R6SIU5_LABRH|nr:hypothetical protein [Labedaea rhizosphaerae]TDQ00829.1 hypothetical protein EV186_102695 [Labedaea rhizosphaerae]
MAQAQERLVIRYRNRLLGLGETYEANLPVFALMSAVLAIPVTGLVRVVQMFTVTGSRLWLGVLGVLPGFVLAVVSLVAVIWAFGSAKQAGARAYGVGLLVSVLAPVLAVEATAGIVTLLWRHGAIVAAHGAAPGLWASERFFLWHTLDAIPFLEIGDTFGWGEPTDLAGGAPSWIVVGLKLLVLIPLARLLVSAFWWLRAKESRTPGDEFWLDSPAGFLMPLLGVTAAAYAFLIWLWPSDSWLARLLDDLVPASVDVAGRHLPLAWVTPSVQWLVGGLLLMFGVFLGMNLIIMLFARFESVTAMAAAVLMTLLWMHIALIMTAAVVILFVRGGIATATPPLPPDAPLTAGIGDQVWGFVNAVPGLDIPKTTHWTRHHAFSGWPVGVLTLGLRLSVVVALLGLLWLLGRLVRSGRNEAAEPD